MSSLICTVALGSHFKSDKSDKSSPCDPFCKVNAAVYHILHFKYLRNYILKVFSTFTSCTLYAICMLNIIYIQLYIYILIYLWFNAIWAATFIAKSTIKKIWLQYNFNTLSTII